MSKRQKDKMDKFKESVSKEGTARPKQGLTPWDKLKEDREKKDADAKALKLKQEQDQKKWADEILKSKRIIDYMVKKIEKCNLDVRNVFNTFDTDKSGSIDQKELKRVLDYCNIVVNEEELHKIFQMIDADGNGKITFKEFCDVMDGRTQLDYERYANWILKLGEFAPKTSEELKHEKKDEEQKSPYGRRPTGGRDTKTKPVPEKKGEVKWEKKKNEEEKYTSLS